MVLQTSIAMTPVDRRSIKRPTPPTRHGAAKVQRRSGNGIFAQLDNSGGTVSSIRCSIARASSSRSK
jgi:hypothetical protein